MAPVSVTAVPPPVIPTKAKRPVPPGIQTNGVSSSTSSPSPSLSAKKPPTSTAKQPPITVNTNGASTTAIRPPNRNRRDIPAQMAGRGSRNSAGLRSASIAADFAVSPATEPRAYVISDRHILRKYCGNPPSLVIHLHATHFRFDQQDGIFPYKSPMRIFLDHLKSRTVPHDLLEYFTQGGVPFYEGCLIVQVHDHKTVAQAKDVARPSSSQGNSTLPSSIHNYNPYLTPSPYVPYPKENLAPAETGNAMDVDGKLKTAEEIDKENMPAPSGLPEGPKSKTPPKPKITTVVLFPTSQSLHMDLAVKAATPRGSGDSRQDGTSGHIPPTTPLTAVPPTPTVSSMPPPSKKQKRERMELDGSNIHAFEANILLATSSVLDLEPTKSIEETIQKLESQAHPDHSHPAPQPKTRKRTVAEMAADEALAAEQERYMLTLDERLASKVGGAQGGANAADGDTQGGAAAFEPRFERFKVIEEIKREHAEKKEQEKIKAAENERRLAQQKQEQMLAQQQQAQQQAQQAQQQQQQQREHQEKLRREQQQAQAREHAAQQQLQEAALRNARAAQMQQSQRTAQAQAVAQAQVAQAAAQAQAAQAQQQGAQNAAGLRQAAHGHPGPNGAMPNGLPNGLPVQAQAQARFAQQVSQPAASSPIVRQNTPQNMSSPLVGGVPMQTSGSNMGVGTPMAASPPRPSSVAQSHAPMAVPMTVSMSARGSQQSQAAGTPRQLNATPNMQQAGTPINRPQQMVQTPRMAQGSPQPGMMTPQQQAQAMLMNQGMQVNMTNPQMSQAAQIAAAQQQQRINAQRMQAAMANNAMNNPQNMAAQQRLLMQQQQMQQMRSQQQNPMMQYGQVVNNMQHQSQLQVQMQQQAQLQNMQRQIMMNGGQNVMGANGLNMSPAQQAQLLALQQQQQQQQAAAAQQQQQQRVGGQMPPAIQQRINAVFNQLWQPTLQNLLNRYGGDMSQVPKEEVEQLRKRCAHQAQVQVGELLKRNNQAQQLMMQQQQQQQAAAMQGMGGMMQNMG